jgi:hypothetical protein
MVGLSCEGVSCWGGPGVEPHGLPYILHTTTSQPMSDTWCPRIGPHVLISFSIQPDMCHLLTRHLSTNQHLPRHPCTVVRSCHIRPYGLYGLYGLVQSASNFLPIWLGEQIAISSPYRVHLTK